MDALDKTISIGSAFTPLLTSAAYWKKGAAEKAAGEAKGASSDFTAQMMRQRGGQEFAASQREALNEKKKTNLVQSALQARSAAQGGASDPSVIKAAGDIAAEGKYRQLTALYKGQDIENYLENAARIKNYEGAEFRRAGEVAKRGARMQAFTSLLGGFENSRSFFQKYNPQKTSDFVAPAWKNPDLYSFDEYASP